MSSYCLEGGDASLVNAGDAAERALDGRDAVAVEQVEAASPAGRASRRRSSSGSRRSARFSSSSQSGDAPSEDDLGKLATFAVRAAHALRASSRSRTTKLELERTRALLAVVGQAISQLSLAHTLETAVARVAELLDADRVAVYLRDQNRLYAAAGIGLAGPHARLAERLLELTLGPFRSRGLLAVDDVALDPRLASVGDAAAEAGIEAVTAVPLLVRDEVIGLLAVFPPRGTRNDRERVGAARRARRAARRRRAERAAARTVQASRRRARARARSRAGGVEAGARALRDLALVRAEPLARGDARGGDEHGRRRARRRRRADPHAGRAPRGAAPARDGALPTRASRRPIRSILFRPQPFGAACGPAALQVRRAVRVNPDDRGGDRRPEPALIPFLERGWTGAAVPIATPAEVLASLTILSMRPGAPLTQETIDEAAAIAGQAALAIDNARLYQQQKQFADTMQRSLLPQSSPSCRAWSSATRTSPPRASKSAATSTTSWSSRTGGLRWRSATSRATASKQRPTWRWRSSCSARSRASIRSRATSSSRRTTSSSARSRRGSSSRWSTSSSTGARARSPPPAQAIRRRASSRPTEACPRFDAHGLVLGIEGGQIYEEVRARLRAGEASSCSTPTA